MKVVVVAAFPTCGGIQTKDTKVTAIQMVYLPTKGKVLRESG